MVPTPSSSWFQHCLSVESPYYTTTRSKHLSQVTAPPPPQGPSTSRVYFSKQLSYNHLCYVSWINGPGTLDYNDNAGIKQWDEAIKMLDYKLPKVCRISWASYIEKQMMRDGARSARTRVTTSSKFMACSLYKKQKGRQIPSSSLILLVIGPSKESRRHPCRWWPSWWTPTHQNAWIM